MVFTLTKHGPMLSRQIQCVNRHFATLNILLAPVSI